MDAGFTNIKAWQKAHEFVLAVYAKKDNFPDYEKFGLWSQFIRAAVSIPANIAEGYRRLSKQEKLRFLNIAQSSLSECQYYVILSRDINYFSEEEYIQMERLIENASYFLNSYVNGIIANNGIKD